MPAPMVPDPPMAPRLPRLPRASGPGRWRELVTVVLTVVAVPAAMVAAPVLDRAGTSPTARPVASTVVHLALDPGGRAVLDRVALAVPGARDSALPGPPPARAVPDAVLVLTPVTPTIGFEMLGVSWSTPVAVPTGGAGAGLTFSVRLREGRSWSGWYDLAVADDQPVAAERTGDALDRAVRGHTEPLVVDGADGVQVRVTAPTPKGVPVAQLPSDLRVDLVHTPRSPADAHLVPAPLAGLLVGSAHAQAASPPIISRATWGADESRRTDAARYLPTIGAVFVHHTASANSYGPDDTARQIRNLYAFSLANGYADIPYNLLVDKWGRVYEGRAGGVDRFVQGGATGGFNRSTTAISFLGNVDVADPARQDSAVAEAIARVAAWKLGQAYLDPAGTSRLTAAGGTPAITRVANGTTVTLPTISGHRDVFATACPGRYLYPLLPRIRALAHGYLGAGFVSPTVAAGSTAYAASTPVTVSAGVTASITWTLTVTSMCGDGSPMRALTGSVAPGDRLVAAWDLRDAGGTPAPPGSYQLALAGSSGGGTPLPWASTVSIEATGSAPASDCPTQRLGGADRYATAVLAGRASAPGSGPVVLVSGADGHLVDGLVVAPLAVKLGAPVLLTGVDELPAVVAAELSARRPSAVYLVGGTASVGAGVAASVARLTGVSPTRLAGTDRYATAVAVATAVGPAADGTVVLAAGAQANLIDALTVGGPAGRVGYPVLLIGAGGLTPEAAAVVARARRTLVVGGRGALPDAVVAGVPGPVRVAGTDRYATGLAVAQ
ncbi:MAG: cell wall-binding repeat-containing protein, partial [Actinomycetes bacterium]